MSSLVMLLGRLTRDPELKELGEKKTPNCRFSVAVNDGYGDKERTVFMDVDTWSKQAETCKTYLKKGSKVQVIGNLRQDSWEKDGVKHNKIFVNADKVEFLDSAPKTKEVEQEDVPGGDIPF